eukprot:tig00000523_g1877.t1
MNVYDLLFHERQDAGLCGQHCLNNLVQQPMWTEVDLLHIATELDRKEREVMAEAGHTAELEKFLREDSGNIAADGNFSVQVLMEALKTLKLSLVPLQGSDPIAATARKDPWNQRAFICNLMEHWFCLRKIGPRWWNLNSLLQTPQLVTETYLSIYLEQLKREGYSIFVVVGELPKCQAEEAEEQGLVADPAKSWAAAAAGGRGSPAVPPGSAKRVRPMTEEEELEAAIAASLRADGGAGAEGGGSAPASSSAAPAAPKPALEDQMLQKALEESRALAAAAREKELPPEPAPEDPAASLVVVRLPNGSRAQRRFPKDATLGTLYGFVESKGYPDVARLVQNLPRKVFERSDETLEAAGLYPRAMLIAERGS